MVLLLQLFQACLSLGVLLSGSVQLQLQFSNFLTVFLFLQLSFHLLELIGAFSVAELEFLCCRFRLDQLCAQVLVDLLNLSYLLITAVNNLKDLISAVFELFLNLKFFLGKLFDHMLLIISHHLELFIQQRDLISHLLSHYLRL